MVSDRAKLVVGAVLALAVVQVFVEDVLVFLGATGAGSGSVPPLVYVAVPGAIALLLVAVLLGWALLTPARSRPRERLRE